MVREGKGEGGVDKLVHTSSPHIDNMFPHCTTASVAWPSTKMKTFTIILINFDAVG